MAKYTRRLACAISERDVERIAEAADLADVTSSEFVRQAIRAALARDLGVPPRPVRKHEPRSEHAASPRVASE
jgi:hypothetical protein